MPSEGRQTNVTYYVIPYICPEQANLWKQEAG